MYSTKMGDETLKFGTSGLLYRSNKLMYDRGTDSLWRQFKGDPVIGRLAESGIQLEVLPMTVTTWGQWLSEHPDTTVLNIHTGVYPASYYAPENDPVSAYYDYRAQPDTMFPVWQRSNALPVKMQVLGLEIGNLTKAYPLHLLGSMPLTHDALGGQDLVIVTSEGAPGSRPYKSDGVRFVSIEHPDAGLEGAENAEAVRPETGRLPVLTDQEGSRWLVQEDALVNETDPEQRLERLPGRVAYWFGWYAFNPDTLIYIP